MSVEESGLVDFLDREGGVDGYLMWALESDGTYRRVDGVYLRYSYLEGKCSIYGVMPRPEGLPSHFSSVEEALRYVDMEHPVSHPGYRVGQIWARNQADMFQLTCLDDVVRMQMAPQSFPFLVHDTLKPESAPWYDVVAYYTSEDK
tara:strand:- start:2030 stop:2467 length:438 start_codon:yes stop_codon:yes gene_type:complete